MKKRTSTKMKGLSAFLSVILLIAAVFPNYALAAEQTGTDPNVSLYSALDDEDLSINAEVATCIAELFVRDMIATGTTVWDETTEPVNTVTMYDETGETPTAFSVELSKGYVVISAYVDVPSPILEWSDDSDPFYAIFQTTAPRSRRSSMDIVYLGGLNYLADYGTDTLETYDGETVLRNELSNSISEMRNSNNVSSELMDIILQKKANQDVSVCSGGLNESGGQIDDAAVYAHNVYGGTWTCAHYRNHWNKYIEKNSFGIPIILTQSDVPSDKPNACTPIAVTNMMKMIGKEKPTTYPSLNSDSHITVFTKVANSFYYSKTDGVSPSAIADFAKSALNKYGVKATFKHNNMNEAPDLNEIYIQRLFQDDPRSFCLVILPNGNEYNPYTSNSGKSHTVLGYAYSNMTNGNGMSRTFLKICDGANKANRYLNVSETKYCFYYALIPN